MLSDPQIQFSTELLALTPLGFWSKEGIEGLGKKRKLGSDTEGVLHKSIELLQQGELNTSG